MDHSPTQKAFISHISFQMHPCPIPLWQVILLFMLFLLLTGNKFLRNSLLQGVWPVFRSCLIHIDLLDDPQFVFLILSDTFLWVFMFAFSMETVNIQQSITVQYIATQNPSTVFQSNFERNSSFESIFPNLYHGFVFVLLFTPGFSCRIGIVINVRQLANSAYPFFNLQ